MTWKLDEEGVIRPDFVAMVRANEVGIARLTNLDAQNAITDWCNIEIGRRVWHPMFHAMRGIRVEMDGDWSSRLAMLADDNEDRQYFWFRDQKKAVLFALRWKGET